MPITSNRTCGEVETSFWGLGPHTSIFSESSDCSSAWRSFVEAPWSHGPPYNPPSYYGETPETECNLYSAIGDPCLPSVALPSRFPSIFTALAGCTLASIGFYDPPSALTPGNGFRTIDPVGSVTTSPYLVSASPGGSPHRPGAPVTQTPSMSPPAPASNASKAVEPSATNGIAPNGGPSLPETLPEGRPRPPNDHPEDATYASNNPLPNNPDPFQTTRLPPHPTAAPKYIIGASTLTFGGIIVVLGTTISLQSDGGAVAIGGSTQAIPDFLASAGNDASVVIGGTTITIAAGKNVATPAYSALPWGNEIAYLIFGGNATPLGEILDSNGYIMMGGKLMSVVELLAGGGYIIVAGKVISLNVLLDAGHFVFENKTISVSALVGDASMVAGEKPIPLGAFLTSSGSVTNDASLIIGTRTIDLTGTRTFGVPTNLDPTQVGTGGIIASFAGLILPGLSSSIEAPRTIALESSTVSGGMFTGGAWMSKINNHVWIVGMLVMGGHLILSLL